MCMLTYLPESVLPDVDALANGAQFNKDGHGYAIVVPGRSPQLIVRHGMNAEHTIERFERDRALFPHGPALFHSRWGTSGKLGKYNCHPFYVGGDKQTVVAHNGVLPGWMQPHVSDKRCDTRKAADELFSNTYGHLSRSAARTRLGADIGAANKLVILTVNPEYSDTSYIVNEGSGIWEGDTWYSNTDYQSWERVTPAFDEWGNVTDCPKCESEFSINKWGYCDVCWRCADCLADLEDCLCWIGTAEEPDDIALAEWWEGKSA